MSCLTSWLNSERKASLFPFYIFGSKVKRKNSGQPPTEDTEGGAQPTSDGAKGPPGEGEKKEKEKEGGSESLAVGNDRRSAVGKIKIREFIKTVSQDSN